MSYLSRIQYTGTGAVALYSIPFAYISKAYIEVRVAGVLLTEGVGYSWQSATSISLTAGNLPTGVVLDIRRATPKTEKLVDFKDGSVLTESDMDLANDQVFHLVGETVDDMADKLSVMPDGTVDAQGRRLKNVGSPLALTDGVNREYADATVSRAEAAAEAAEAALAVVTPASASAQTSAADALQSKVSAQEAAVAAVAAAGTLFNHGQCRLKKSGSALLLIGFNGNKLIINGTSYAIPVSGVSLAAPATTAITYFIYAYMAGAVMTLEASATGHTTDIATGVEIKSGDATRTLVGIARTASNAWADSSSQRLVRSWFNRPGATMTRSFTAQRSTTSGSFVELNSEIRCEFLCFSDDKITAGINGYAANSTTDYCRAAVAFDGTTRTGEPGIVFGTNGGNIACSVTEVLAEGYHYATVLGANVNGSSTVSFGSVAGFIGLTVGVA